MYYGQVCIQQNEPLPTMARRKDDSTKNNLRIIVIVTENGK